MIDQQVRAAADPLDWRLQEPDRLDSLIGRQRTTNPGPDSFNHTGQWRLTVLQCSQFAPNPRSLDADVLYS